VRDVRAARFFVQLSAVLSFIARHLQSCRLRSSTLSSAVFNLIVRRLQHHRPPSSVLWISVFDFIDGCFILNREKFSVSSREVFSSTAHGFQFHSALFSL